MSPDSYVNDARSPQHPVSGLTIESGGEPRIVLAGADLQDALDEWLDNRDRAGVEQIAALLTFVVARGCIVSEAPRA